MNDRLRTAIIITVTLVWVLNFAARFVVPGYAPSESINGIFGIIVGALFALGERDRRRNGGSGG